MKREIRVHYPAGAQLALRTDGDWGENILPSRLEENGSVRVFDVSDATTKAGTLYFKPVRLRQGHIDWSLGSNYGCGPSGRALFPAFSPSQGEITSRVDVGPCTLRIYLPPGYRENTLKRYPVVYMHDGSNLFFPHEAFGGVDWGVDRTLNQLTQTQLIDKMIVVGIYAGHGRNSRYTLPGYRTYADALEAQVLPFINANFRTLTGPAHTASVGSSLGGVVSFFLAFDRPAAFGMAGCFSSTFGWQDDLVERVASEPKRPIRLYLDSGWPNDNYQRNRSMRDALLQAGYAPGTDFLHFVFPGEAHSEAAWADRLHLPFQFLFGRQFTPRNTS